MTQTLYKILQQFTDEWELIDPRARKLTKEQCNALLNQYLAEGVNPNDLRAVVDND